MRAYKKRLRANWNQGKHAKGDGDERQYAKREIAQALQEMRAEYRDRHLKAGRTPNVRARLEYRIQWYTEVLARYEVDGRTGSILSYFRDGLAKAKARLAELK